MSRSSFRGSPRQHNGTGPNPERPISGGRGAPTARGAHRGGLGHASAVGGSPATGDRERERSQGKVHHERLLFCLFHLVGEEVEVETKNQDYFHGVLHACSVESLELGVVLKVARKRLKSEEFSTSPADVMPKVIIQGSELVQIVAANIGVDELVARSKSSMNDRHSRTGFQTDKQIGAKSRAESGRELKRFDDYASEASTDIAVGGGLSGRRDGWDQFAANEQKFGIRTSYNEHEYTTVLDKSQPGFEDKEKEAAKIAAEIESKVSRNMHLKSERGQLDDSAYDEENLFSTVLSQEAKLEESQIGDDPTTKGLRQTDSAILKAVPSQQTQSKPDNVYNGSELAPGPVKDALAGLAESRDSVPALTPAVSRGPQHVNNAKGKQPMSGRNQSAANGQQKSSKHHSKGTEPASAKSNATATQSSNTAIPKFGDVDEDKPSAAAKTTPSSGGSKTATSTKKMETVKQGEAAARAEPDATTSKAANEDEAGVSNASSSKGTATTETEKQNAKGKAGGEVSAEKEKSESAKGEGQETPKAAPTKKVLKFNPNAAEFHPSATPAVSNAMPTSAYYPMPGGEMRHSMPAAGVFPGQPAMLNPNFLGWSGGGRGGMMPPNYVPHPRVGITMVPAPQLPRHVTSGGVPMMPYVPIPNQHQQFIPQSMFYPPQPGGMQPFTQMPGGGGSNGGHHMSTGSNGSSRRGGRNQNKPSTGGQGGHGAHHSGGGSHTSVSTDSSDPQTQNLDSKPLETTTPTEKTQAKQSKNNVEIEKPVEEGLEAQPSERNTSEEQLDGAAKDA